MIFELLEPKNPDFAGKGVILKPLHHDDIVSFFDMLDEAFPYQGRGTFHICSAGAYENAIWMDRS